MTNITPRTAADLGRAAAHAWMTEAQLAAMIRALGHTKTSAIARHAETARRRRLIWVAEGMGTNEADPSVSDAELEAIEADEAAAQAEG